MTDFKTIDANALGTVNGGLESPKKQITGRLDESIGQNGVLTGLRVKCGDTDKAGVMNCSGTYHTFLGPGGGIENDKFNATFDSGKLKSLHHSMTGGD
jgi:hypothetical protein